MERRRGPMTKGITMYRMGCVTVNREAIGSVLERRRADRSVEKNMQALLAEARRLFGNGPGEAIDIVIDYPDSGEPAEGTGDGNENRVTNDPPEETSGMGDFR